MHEAPPAPPQRELPQEGLKGGGLLQAWGSRGDSRQKSVQCRKGTSSACRRDLCAGASPHRAWCARRDSRQKSPWNFYAWKVLGDFYWIRQFVRCDPRDSGRLCPGTLDARYIVQQRGCLLGSGLRVAPRRNGSLETHGTTMQVFFQSSSFRSVCRREDPAHGFPPRRPSVVL